MSATPFTILPQRDMPEPSCVEEFNRVKESIRRREALLATSARASRLLLESPDTQAAIPNVLRMLGEAASADRVNLTLSQNGADGQALLVLVSEWVADGVVPYLGNPAMTVKDERNFPDVCQQLRAGRSVCINQPDPGKYSGLGLESVDTVSKAVVPIFVDSEFIGVVGFDNTRQRRAIDSAELAALETAAGVIGAALHRERLLDEVRRERERATEEQMAELARANAAIRGNLERLASEPDLCSFMGHVLLEATRQLDATAGTIVVLDEAQEQWHVKAHVRQGQIEDPPFPQSVPRAELELNQRLDQGKGPFYFDIAQDAEQFSWPGVLDYHRREGYAVLFVLPLIFGEHVRGYFMLAFPRREPVAPPRTELLVALSQQATLALELTRRANAAKKAAVLTERNRIGQEIHDGLAQAFTGILMQLGAAEELQAFEPDSPLAMNCQRIRDLARDGLAEARRSVMALRPDQTRRAGLELALRQLAERSTVSDRVVCLFEGGGFATGVRPEHEHELLRIAQEAVSNAMRHAQPNEVRIAMLEEAFTWALVVSDNGRGMYGSPESNAQRGFGLNSMRERAGAIGGEWEIDSRPGKGTVVSVRMLRRNP